MIDQPDRAREQELVVTLFMSIRAQLGVRDALAATRWIREVVARSRGTWN